MKCTFLNSILKHYFSDHDRAHVLADVVHVAVLLTGWPKLFIIRYTYRIITQHTVVLTLDIAVLHVVEADHVQDDDAHVRVLLVIEVVAAEVTVETADGVRALGHVLGDDGAEAEVVVVAVDVEKRNPPHHM